MNKKRLIFIVYLLNLFVCSLVQAYPIFFKCDQNKQMSEFLSGKELLDGLKKMQESLGGDQKKLLETLCKGKLECEKNLLQMMTLVNISKEAVEIEREKSISLLNQEMSSSPIKKVSTEGFELEKNIRSLASEVNSCRQTSTQLDPNLWEKNQCITFYYPFKNEYSYASGFKIKNNIAESTSPGMGCINKSELQSAIKKAYLMGVDPLVYLSIGLMEGGSGGWTGLSLDPIGIIKAIGCEEKKGDVTKSNETKLSSFGNFHKVSPGLIKNPDLSNRMQQYYESKNIKIAKEKKYICTPVTSGDPSVLNQPDSSQCCLELNFKVDNVRDVPKLLTMEYLHKMSSVHPYDSLDPAFQMQFFNGFSKLMGGAEAVPAFRSGVDYTKSPAYGYQAMDFIINNLAGNPWLARELDNQKNELKLDHAPPSLLCQNASAKGSNYLDSRHYFDLHRNSGRMISIKNKPYNQMTEREKRVIDKEITASIQKKLFPNTINSKHVPSVNEETPFSDNDIFKFEYEIKKSDNTNVSLVISPLVLSTTTLGDLLNKDKLKKGYSYKSLKLDYTVTPINQSIIMGVDSTSWFPESIDGLMYNNKPPFELQFADGSVYSMKENYSSTCKDKSGKAIECYKFRSDMGGKPGQSFKCILANGKGFEVKVHNAKVPLNSYFNLADNSKAEESKITYADGDWAQISLTTKKMLMTKEGTIVDAPSKPPIDKNEKKVTKAELVDYYFKNIYQSRSTIEKASSYGPWREFNDEEIKLMSDAIKSTNQGNVIEVGSEPPPGFGGK